MEIDLKRIIDQVCKDKGLTRAAVIDALQKALVMAARRRFGLEREIEAQYNESTGEIELFEFKTVVESVTDPATQVLLAEALSHDSEVETDDQIGLKIDTTGFGRIAAQTAKQVIIQEVRGAERQIVYDEYKDRVGEVVNGIVRRIEKGNLIVDLGRAEGIVPRKEQVPREMYRVNERIRAYILEVQKEARGQQVLLSRSCTQFLTKLFEQEVPEIYEGIVQISAAAREPGARAKVAVSSRDNDVDPVGACVGMRGSRVQAVVGELRGEKIDIVPWSSDSVRYVCNALAPAQVVRVMVDDVNKQMDVVVPDDQLSLAIGRKGQNVRLAVQLTGFRIDIKSETKMLEAQGDLEEALSVVEGAGEAEARLLLDHGVSDLAALAEAETEFLAQIPGISAAGAARAQERAREIQAERLAAAAEAEAEQAAREAQPETPGAPEPEPAAPAETPEVPAAEAVPEAVPEAEPAVKPETGADA
ncbi:MAG: transcription termination/antitermination protein NusA [Myxococcales bacterium]|nr:transcription termination/antitermination protein NusA [Myxococcales bacterium]